MGNDDKLDDDPLAGKLDAASYAARIQRVVDIVNRAQSRFNKVLGEPGPTSDPAVMTALQAVVSAANALSASATAKLPAGTPGTAP